jgi:protein-S-isoprenylcysteine O-methyltransferase Ste14
MSVSAFPFLFPRPRLSRADTTPAWRAFERSKFYDALTAAPLILWYGASASQLVPALEKELAKALARAFDLYSIVLVLAQSAAILLILTAMVFLVLRRPALAKAKGLVPRFTAIGGTYLGLLVVWLPSHPLGLALSLISLLLMLGGAGFATFALLHLGRSFSLMAEARRLVTDGPYKAVRHPLYLGEAISMLGLTLQHMSPLAFAILALQCAFQIERMKNEERVLKGLFPEYGAYSAHTARLVPGVF